MRLRVGVCSAQARQPGVAEAVPYSGADEASGRGLGSRSRFSAAARGGLRCPPERNTAVPRLVRRANRSWGPGSRQVSGAQIDARACGGKTGGRSTPFPRRGRDLLRPNPDPQGNQHRGLPGRDRLPARWQRIGQDDHHANHPRADSPGLGHDPLRRTTHRHVAHGSHHRARHRAGSRSETVVSVDVGAREPADGRVCPPPLRSARHRGQDGAGAGDLSAGCARDWTRVQAPCREASSRWSRWRAPSWRSRS